MSTNTYTALRTTTLTSSAATVTLDLTGITGYTDLVLACNVIYDTTTANVQLYYNGDTGSNYSTTILAGNGSGATSTRFSNQSNGWLTDYYGGTANEPFTKIIHIMNYANTTTYKTGICRNSSGREAMAGVGLWRSTAAITSLTLKQGGNFLSGSTFTVYGLAAAPAWAAKATGGTITYDVGYTYHTFTSSGTFTPLQALTCDYLVVAGGGGGSGEMGGGGGAGGLRSTVTATGGGGALESALALSATGYTVTVGAGGAGGGGTYGAATISANGSNSVFGAITSIGGGGTGSNTSSTNGLTGGSGGGTAYGFTGGSGTANQGYAGGTGANALPYTYAFQGGGGGAGAAGANGGPSTGGNGGIGVAVAISGTLAYYAGGGGGGSYQDFGNGGAGGTGGGGGSPGSGFSDVAGTAGGTNTGGGGGSAHRGTNGSAGASGGNGGSGIVIIRYAN